MKHASVSRVRTTIDLTPFRVSELQIVMARVFFSLGRCTMDASQRSGARSQGTRLMCRCYS